MRVSDSNYVTLAKDRKDRFGNLLAHLNFSYSQDDLKTLDLARGIILDTYRKLGATDVYEDQVTWSRHHQGTCRMGENPNTSVTDPDLRVHECPNLFICGSEVFVTGSAAPPVLTIAALAYRLADHIVGRLQTG
jgi:choline dehydrogenase-like flavoprotein